MARFQQCVLPRLSASLRRIPVLSQHLLSTTSAVPSAVPTALVVGETRSGALAPGTLSAVTFARKVVGKSGRVELLLDSCEKGLPKVPQVEGVLVSDYGGGVAERVAQGVINAVEEGRERFGWLIGDGGSFGKNVMARVAGIMGVMGIGDVVGVDRAKDSGFGDDRKVDDWAYRRCIYAGAGIETVKVMEGKTGVFTVRGAGFEKAGPVSSWRGSVKKINSEKDDQRVKIVKNVGSCEAVDVGTARVVVAGGRGLKSREHFTMLEALAKVLNGAVGATRAAVDAGWCSNDMQVGQTGRIVAPELYIGVGISGAIQHLAGMKESKFIVAVNKDRKAPIFQIADYGLVGNLFDVVPELTTKLKELGVSGS